MADSHTEAVASNDEHHLEDSEVKRLQWAIEKLEELKDHLSKDIGTRILVEIFTSIIDSLVRDVCTDIHRDICFDVLPLPNEDSQNLNRIVQAAGYDVHGQVSHLAFIFFLPQTSCRSPRKYRKVNFSTATIVLKRLVLRNTLVAHCLRLKLFH